MSIDLRADIEKLAQKKWLVGWRKRLF